MILAFAEAGNLMPRPTIPRSCFLKQEVFQNEIGYDLLEGGGLAKKILHLGGGCSTRMSSASRRLSACGETL
jgi:hypothetical protein